MRTTTMLAMLISVLALASYAESEQRALGEPSGFLCHGCEPFWSLTVNRSGVVLKQPGSDDLRFDCVQPETPVGSPADSVLIYRLVASPPAAPCLLIISTSEPECSDGMSEVTYTHSALFIGPGFSSRGCAQRIPWR